MSKKGSYASFLMPHCPVTVVQRYRDGVCNLLYHLICHPYIPLDFLYILAINVFNPDSDPECWSIIIAGRQEFHCSFQTQLVSVRCSFDAGEPENCSLPLVVDSERFSTESHYVNVTVTDELDQLWELTFAFKLGKCTFLYTYCNDQLLWHALLCSAGGH